MHETTTPDSPATREHLTPRYRMGFLYLWKFLPETRGKSLEQIERELVDQID
jgi:hypothetical protein